MDLGRKSLADFIAGKTQLALLDRFNNTGIIDVKMDRSAFEEKLSLKMLGLTFSSKLDWDSYVFSIVKTAFKEIGALIPSMNCFSPEVALCLYKSTIRPRIEHSCYVWAGALSCYLELQKQIFRTLVPSLAAPIELLAHGRNA